MRYVAILLSLAAALSGVSCSRTTPYGHKPEIVSISIDPANPEVYVNKTLRLTATAVKSNGTKVALADAAWSVSPAIARVVGAGGVAELRGLRAGTAELTVTSARAALVKTVTLKVLGTGGPDDPTLEVSPAALDLAIGEGAALIATVVAKDGTTTDVTKTAIWTSRDPAIATVDDASAKGRALGLAAGTTALVASYAGLEASSAVTVRAATLEGLVVQPAELTLAQGLSAPLVAIALYSDGSTSDVTELATWSSNDEEIATVAQGGVARAGLRAGEATITAAWQSFSASSAIHVVAASIKAVEVTPSVLSLAKDTTSQLTATAIFDGDTLPPQDVTDLVDWSTSDAAIVALMPTARGAIRAVGRGEATVTATLMPGLAGTAVVTVTDVTLASLAISPETLTLARGTSERLTATGTFTDGSTQDLTEQATWTSSDPARAAVSNADGSRGEVQALASGTATVTASVLGASDSISVTVTSVELVSVRVQPATLQLVKGTTGKLTATATFSDGSTSDVTDTADWISSENTVVSVSTLDPPRGVVTAFIVGGTAVHASVLGKTGSATVLVSPATLQSLSIAPLDPSVSKGTTLQMSATGTFSDGTTQPVTDLVTWESRDAAVATLSNADGSHGLLTARGVGTTAVSASLDGQVASATVTVTPAALTSLVVAPASMTLEWGGQQQARATARYADSTTVDVTDTASWISGDTSIATVVRGLVSAGKAGNTRVTATLDGQSSSVAVTINAPKVTRVEVRPATASVPAGLGGSFQAFALFADGTEKDVTTLAVWASSDSCVEVGNLPYPGGSLGSGVFQTYRGPCKAVVTAEYQLVVGEATVEVLEPRPLSLSLRPATSTIEFGASVSFTATATFTDMSVRTVTAETAFTSAAPSVVSLTANVAKGVKAGGPVTITGTYSGLTATAQVTVLPPKLVSLRVAPDTLVMEVRTTTQLRAYATYADGSSAEVTDNASWKSSDPMVAGVTSFLPPVGQVGASRPGTAIITASFGGLSANATITVIPIKPLRVEVRPASLSLQAGSKGQLQVFAFYPDGSSVDITPEARWTSSAPCVQVGTTGSSGTLRPGEVSGASACRATVTAEYAGLTGTASVEVTPAVPTFLRLLPQSASIEVNGTVTFEATAIYADGRSEDVTAQATYTSDGAAILSMSGNVGKGLAAGGPVRVTARYQGLTATASIVVTLPGVMRVTLVPAALTLQVGATSPLRAIATFTDGSTLDVTDLAAWFSDDDSIAAVSTDAAPRGVVTGLAAGRTTVRANYGGGEGTAAITVQAPQASRLEVRPGSVVVASGTRGYFRAYAIMPDGTERDVTSEVVWSSSDPSVVVYNAGATGQQAGDYWARAAGGATITATLGALRATASVLVTDPIPESLVISPTTPRIRAGDSVSFTVSVVMSDGTRQDVTKLSTYTSGDIAVVGMTDNVAWGIKAGGPVTVTAKYQGLSAIAQVTVYEATFVSILLSPDALTIKPGDSATIRCIASYSDGSTKDVTGSAVWSSTNSGIASVSVGSVKGVTVGDAVITATFMGLSASARVTVGAPTLQRIAIVPPNAVLRINIIYPYQAFALYSDGSSVDVTQVCLDCWGAFNTSVATPYNYNGYFGVWAVDAGTTRVFVGYGGKTGYTGVQVYNSYLIGSEVSPARLTVPVGVATKFAGVFAYDDGWAVEIQNPDWSSKNTAVAKVGANGVVTAVAPGTTDIQMTAWDMSGSYTSTATVTVTPAKLTSIALDVPPRMIVGLSSRVKATGTFSDGTQADLGLSTVWSSSNLTLATILPDVDGAKVTAKAAGQVTISGSFSGVSQSVPVTLSTAALTSLDMTVDQKNLPLGGASPVSVTATYADGTKLDVTDSVTYSASAPDIAMISSGLFTTTALPYVLAMSPGTSTVRATLSGKTASADISVSGATLSSVGIAVGSGPVAPTLTLAGPGPHTLRAVGSFSDGSTADITPFTSWWPGQAGPGVIATVSNATSGKVTVIGMGTEQVRATYAPTFIGQPMIRGSATLIVK